MRKTSFFCAPVRKNNALTHHYYRTNRRKLGGFSVLFFLSSELVNDNVPYEVVRRTLGHRGKNAIKSYAKLDVEQLRAYSLEPPEATGCFAEFLAGRWPVK